MSANAIMTSPNPRSRPFAEHRASSHRLCAALRVEAGVIVRARRFFSSIGCSLPAATSDWSASIRERRSVRSTSTPHQLIEMLISLPYISAGDSLMPMRYSAISTFLHAVEPLKNRRHQHDLRFWRTGAAARAAEQIELLVGPPSSTSHSRHTDRSPASRIEQFVEADGLLGWKRLWNSSAPASARREVRVRDRLLVA